MRVRDFLLLGFLGLAGCDSLFGISDHSLAGDGGEPGASSGVGSGNSGSPSASGNVIGSAGRDASLSGASASGASGASNTDAELKDEETPAETGSATDSAVDRDATSLADAAVGCPAAMPNTCGDVCTNVASDPKNCGACGHDCTALKNVAGPAVCNAGACSVPASSCAAGWMHCSVSPNDGCETDITKPSNCGSCTTVCSSAAPRCSGSGNSYTCVTGCSSPEPTLCGSSCVDTTSNATYCGNCTTMCMGGMTCQNSECKCPAGKVNCSGTCEDPGPQNGCASGGVCGTACPSPTAGNGAATCTGTSCAISCSSSTPTLCGSSCVDTTSNASHCGNCTTSCTGGTTCQSGACKCPAGQIDCGGSCESASPQNGCGSSAACTACPGPTSGTGTATCSGPSCAISCSGSTTTPCGSACVNAQSDPNNCGGCGTQCSASQICSGGRCGCSASLCPSGNTCVGPNACGGCAALAAQPSGLCDCGSGNWACATTNSVSCNVTRATTCQNDQQCVDMGSTNSMCQCDTVNGMIHTIQCADGTFECSGWNFASGLPEGWALDTRTGSSFGGVSTPVVAGGMLEISVMQGLNGGNAGFSIVKSLCAGHQGVDPSVTTNVKVTMNSSDPTDVNANTDELDPFFANGTDNSSTDEAGGNPASWPPDDYVSTATTTIGTAGGENIVQVGLEIELFNVSSTAPSTVTIYVTNIVLN